MKTWSCSQNYVRQELQVDKDGVVFKEYWDSSRDPNRSTATLAEFVDGALNSEVKFRIGDKELEEALGYARDLLKV
ncbi:MAG: hypothetical protein NT027_09440 [Proteobacteria bacterium]|nr:hypothetical protein [Pseudomonadota bacterium]